MAECQFFDSAVLKGRVGFQGDLKLETLEGRGIEKLVGALGEDEEVVVPDLELFDFFVVWDTDSLLEVTIYILDIDGL